MTVAETAESRRIDRSFRVRLVGGAVCWLMVGIANVAITYRFDWYPRLVGIMALCTAACTLILAIRPATGFAYRYGGTLAVGTLVLRGVSVVEGAMRTEDADFVWLAMNQIAITALLGGTYAWGWLHEVKTWHRAHRLLDA